MSVGPRIQPISSIGPRGKRGILRIVKANSPIVFTLASNTYRVGPLVFKEDGHVFGCRRVLVVVVLVVVAFVVVAVVVVLSGDLSTFIVI